MQPVVGQRVCGGCCGGHWTGLPRASRHPPAAGGSITTGGSGVAVTGGSLLRLLGGPRRVSGQALAAAAGLAADAAGVVVP